MMVLFGRGVVPVQRRSGESRVEERRIQMRRCIGIGILVFLLGGVIVYIYTCTPSRGPSSRGLVTDSITFDKDNRTHRNVEFVRVNPNGAVVLHFQDTGDTITVRASEPTTLPNGARAVVIASDPELQTATIRASIEAKGR